MTDRYERIRAALAMSPTPVPLERRVRCRITRTDFWRTT